MPPHYSFYYVGYETARSLALHGATVTMACRNMEAAHAARGKILSEHPTAKVEVMYLDLASLKTVSEMANAYLDKDW